MRQSHSHFSEEVTLFALKPAVADGGIDCDAVDVAATEAALDVTMVWALAKAAKADAISSDWENILIEGMWCSW